MLRPIQAAFPILGRTITLSAFFVGVYFLLPSRVPIHASGA